MRLSVVIPAFNEENYITGCLEHLFKQKELPDEIIVVNNNSTDRTEEFAKKFPIRILSEKKQGITPARNAGFNAAKYAIISRIDADTLVPPNWVKDIKKRFESDLDMAAFSGSTVFVNKSLDVLLKPFGFAYYSSFKHIFGCGCMYGTNMAIRKNVWLKVKPFLCNNDCLVHEDADLAIHISELRLGKIIFDPNFLVKVSNRRYENINSSYVEYPYRYFKTILHHKKSLQSFDRSREIIENTFSKTTKAIKQFT